jgi:hypothetical protein
MKLIKSLYKQEFPEKDKEQNLVIDTIGFAVYKDKIFVEESANGFQVGVFDCQGNRLYEIKKDFKPRKITQEDKEQLLEEFKKDTLVSMLAKGSGGWENYKKTLKLVYPETLPTIQDIIVTDGRIYISTYDQKDNKEKFVIMGLKGNIISTPYLPISMKTPFSAKAFGVSNRFYGITGNKFYYLKENEEEETWELHVTGIND